MKKTLVGAALVAAALKLALMAGADEGMAHLVKQLGSDRALISATIDLELGGALSAEQENAGQTLTLHTVPVISQSPVRQEQAVNLGEERSAAVETAVITSSVEIRNDTSLDIDPQAILEQGTDIHLQPGQPQILIIHTHGSEAYTQTPGDLYEASDPYRTQDCSHNVVKLGDVLEQVLESYGLEVIHDRGIYDYPSYTGSYSRSGAAVEEHLAQYPSIEIVIDLHRDAIGSEDVVYKTQADIGGQACAQVMLLVGTGENGLAHPNWRENLALALSMQRAMDGAYPSLARPLAIKSERYNQHLTNGSLILEVGSTGNTLDEAVRAVELFGQAVGPVLAELIADE